MLPLLTESADLLADYRPGRSFYFASDRGTLLAEGTAATVATGPWGEAAAGLRAELAALHTLDQVDGAGVPGTPRPVVAVGVLPFDSDRPGHLVVPARIQESGPNAAARGPVALPAAVPGGGGARPARSLPNPADYADGVARAVERIRAGELDKVVLARVLRVPGPVDAVHLLRRLAARDPHAYLFGAETGPVAGASAFQAPGSTLVGASPELLLSRRGPLVVSNPLAGSAARSPDPVEDRRRAAALLASSKDAYEHALVVRAIAERLRPFCLGLDVPAAPSLIRTATMWHLSTRISGWLADPDVSALRLAAAVHPTPAVCGWPTTTARRVIGELEPFDRGCYTGLVGWCDASGDGEWALAIRCAQITEDGAMSVYAGAGIVAASDPSAELAETSAKLRTIGAAAGLGEDL
ncbi:isochorismate synthase [Frankia sp. AgPm24]|nr:isochorismate synthase [Frankia sp. AgPm24]